MTAIIVADSNNNNKAATQMCVFSFALQRQKCDCTFNNSSLKLSLEQRTLAESADIVNISRNVVFKGNFEQNFIKMNLKLSLGHNLVNIQTPENVQIE